MKWIIMFNDGSSKIAFGTNILQIANQLNEWDYPMECVVSIMLFKLLNQQ